MYGRAVSGNLVNISAKCLLWIMLQVYVSTAGSLRRLKPLHKSIVTSESFEGRRRNDPDNRFRQTFWSPCKDFRRKIESLRRSVSMYSAKSIVSGAERSAWTTLPCREYSSTDSHAIAKETLIEKPEVDSAYLKPIIYDLGKHE